MVVTIRSPPRGPSFSIPGALTSCPTLLPGIFRKDLLATLHLLVALAKHFQPDLPLPPNVQVEVIIMEVRVRPRRTPACRSSISGLSHHMLDQGADAAEGGG